MITNELTGKKYPNSKKLLIWGLMIFILATVLVIFMPLIVTQSSWISLKLDKPNEIGDTIGGILGPCVGLIAAILTFLAFWAQYDANIEQRKQFDILLSNERTASLEEKERIMLEQEIQNNDFLERQKQFEKTQTLQQQQILLQDKRSRIELFETRFYTMLSIQRDNAINIEVNKIKGRKVFLHLLDELKLLYNIFVAINDEILEEKDKLNDETVYNIAYLSFFFGIGEKSTPLVLDLIDETLIDFVNKAHEIISTQIKKSTENRLNYILFELNNKQFKWDKVYSLGVGHLRRLSHYVRHLYQIVKFVDSQPNELINQDAKYNYISNLRAQLSVHEQLLLYYNAISVLGKPWMEKKHTNGDCYIELYCMLKSIPLNAPDFYKKPTDFFGNINSTGKSMFEWVKIKKRMEDFKKTK